MKRPVRITLTALLGLGIATDAAVMILEYRHADAEIQLEYTGFNRDWDVYETSHSALSALQDAVVQAQGYALTGETAYAEAYSKDVSEWQDSFGTLELLVRTNKGAKIGVRELSQKAGKVLDSLALLVSARDKGSSETALEQLRKGSATVYIAQARTATEKIFEVGPSRHVRDLLEWALRLPERLAQGAVAMFSMMLALLALLVADNRSSRKASRS